MTSQFVVTDSRLPSDRLMLADVVLDRGPYFTVADVAKFFFARTAHWIRWRERKGFLVFEGQPIGKRKTLPNGKLAARAYDLADVERMAHALAEQQAINGAQLSNVLLLVRTEAQVWGYLT